MEVKCLNSRKWVARIQHPISKVWVLLGTYTTSEKAQDTCTRKKLEYESRSVQESMPSSIHTNIKDFEKCQGVKRTKSGKWRAKIKHNKGIIWLGTYNTPEEAADAFNMSKLQLDSQKLDKRKAVGKKSCDAGLIRPQQVPKINTDAERNVPQNRPRHAYQQSSGRWKTKKRNPITRTTVYLGTFDTAQEAEIAYNNKRHEFVLIACNHSKHSQSNDMFEADAVAEGKSNSNCVSNKPSVPTDGSSVINASEEKESLQSMINVNVDSMLTCATETAREFDLGIVDSYVQLIGEYSRLDDELWIC